jgi:hypothetical protein
MDPLTRPRGFPKRESLGGLRLGSKSVTSSGPTKSFNKNTAEQRANLAKGSFELLLAMPPSMRVSRANVYRDVEFGKCAPGKAWKEGKPPLGGRNSFVGPSR